MHRTRRLAIVIACHLLSAYGILCSLMLAGMAGAGSPGAGMVGLLIVLAWLCHLVMSIGWVLDRPARRWLPICGSVAGSAALLAWPVANPALERFSISDALGAAVMGGGFVLPCLLLALHLVRFHLTAHRPAGA